MKTFLTTFTRFFTLALVLSVALPPAGEAYSQFKFGFGTDLPMTFFDKNFSGGAGSVALGFRGRLSQSVSPSVRLAGDLAFFGYVWNGSDNAIYYFNPQASVVINFPGRNNWYPYAIAGFGGFLPIGTGHDAKGGPAVHFGMGWVYPLQGSSIYLEIDPQLVIGSTSASFILPLRFGLIL